MQYRKKYYTQTNRENRFCVIRSQLGKRNLKIGKLRFLPTKWRKIP